MFRRVVGAGLCLLCPSLGLLFSGHPALAAGAPLLVLLPWVVPVAVYAAGLEPGAWFLVGVGTLALAFHLVFPALALALPARHGLPTQRAAFYGVAVLGWFVALASAAIVVDRHVLA